METRSHPIRVLVRPPSATAPSHPLPPQPPPPPPPPPDPSPPPKSGVIVVGFVGRRHHDVAHLINKISDSYAFGSGSLDTPFRLEAEKIDLEMSRWFESRNLSFYHDEDQGILYLQFSMVNCTVAESVLSEERLGFESVLEERELGDLKGLIFMFSVSGIIICKLDFIFLLLSRLLKFLWSLSFISLLVGLVLEVYYCNVELIKNEVEGIIPFSIEIVRDC